MQGSKEAEEATLTMLKLSFREHWRVLLDTPLPQGLGAVRSKHFSASALTPPSTPSVLDASYVCRLPASAHCRVRVGLCLHCCAKETPTLQASACVLPGSPKARSPSMTVQAKTLGVWFLVLNPSIGGLVLVLGGHLPIPAPGTEGEGLGKQCVARGLGSSLKHMWGVLQESGHLLATQSNFSERRQCRWQALWASRPVVKIFS